MPEDSKALRVPPHSEEAEQSVLGSMMMDRDAVSTAAENLTPDDFYNRKNAELFSVMLDLYHEGQSVDMVTVISRLKTDGNQNAMADSAYLSNVAMAVPSSVHIRDYVSIVKEKALYRRFISLGNEIIETGFKTEASIEDLSDDVEKKVFHILQNRGSSDFVHIHDVLISSVDFIEELSQKKDNEGVIGVPSGFIDLDRKTAGFQPSDLILVGARPSMGKSAFGLNIVQYAAVNKHKTCAVFTLEMSRVQVVNRMLSCESNVEAEKLRTGKLDSRDWKNISAAIPPLADAPIYIDDTPGITISEIRSKCRKLKLEKGLDLVLIDYLQLVSAGHNIESRQLEISEISRNLKALAREMECPVIALSQLNRALETRSDRRPMLSDLRESGAIEQDADLVLFLYRDEYYHPDTEDKNVAEVSIAKQRNGSTGVVKLAFLSQYTRFANLQF